jgi:hypothetical protein
MMKRYATYLIFLVVVISACKKKAVDNPSSDSNSDIKIQFKHVSDLKDFNLSTDGNNYWYLNQNNDSFTVTRFNYYFTNIRLIAEDGSEYAEPESYHLIRAEHSPSLQFTIKDVPHKKYVALSYMIGVEAEKNKNGANTGDLSPDYLMHWGWLSGYIFLKLEGKHKKNGIENDIVYHIGGYDGKYVGIRTKVLNFNSTLDFTSNKTIQVTCNVNEIFKNPEIIDLSQLRFSMTPSQNSTKIADNYIDMFQISSIE